MSRPVWLVELIKKAFPAAVPLAKATKNRAVGAIVEKTLFEGDDLMILPKNRVIEVNQTLDAPESIVLPSDIVKHFVERASVRWLMNTCICRESSSCCDYPIDLGSLMLGDSASQINPALGRAVDVAEALEHLERCREAGLVHLVGRNKLDSVWLGASPGYRLMTICNCCECCCIWRILPHLASDLADKVTRMPGVKVAVDEDLCEGCRSCEQDVCFVDAIHVEGDRATIDDTMCRGCGRCVDACPNDAIELIVEDDGFVRQSIARLGERVDVT